MPGATDARHILVWGCNIQTLAPDQRPSYQMVCQDWNSCIKCGKLTQHSFWIPSPVSRCAFVAAGLPPSHSKCLQPCLCFRNTACSWTWTRRRWSARSTHTHVQYLIRQCIKLPHSRMAINGDILCQPQRSSMLCWHAPHWRSELRKTADML